MAESVAVRKISSILEEMNQMQDRIMRRAYDLFEQKGRGSAAILTTGSGPKGVAVETSRGIARSG